MASMDPKILAAVFASIAALAVGSGGGSMDGIQNFTDGDIMSGISLPSSDILDKLREKPEPTENVTVTATMSSNKSSIKLESGELSVSNFERLSSGDRKLDSDHELSFRTYKGTVILQEPNSTLIRGSSQGFTSGGVNLSQKFKMGFETDAEEIAASGIERKKITIKDVDVEMVSGDGTEISRKDTNLNINSFSGIVRLNPAGGEIVLEGRVDRLEAGGTVFKG
jgi:hypothetical protein